MGNRSFASVFWYFNLIQRPLIRGRLSRLIFERLQTLARFFGRRLNVVAIYALLHFWYFDLRNRLFLVLDFSVEPVLYAFVVFILELKLVHG